MEACGERWRLVVRDVMMVNLATSLNKAHKAAELHKFHIRKFHANTNMYLTR